MKFYLGRKRDHISLIFIFVFSFFLTFYSCTFNSDSEILGKWVLTYDPDNPGEVEDDMMVFKKNGKVDIRSTTKVHQTCSYEEYEDSVDITCIVKGSEITLELLFAEDRTELHNSSGAVYTFQ